MGRSYKGGSYVRSGGKKRDCGAALAPGRVEVQLNPPSIGLNEFFQGWETVAEAAAPINMEQPPAGREIEIEIKL